MNKYEQFVETVFAHYRRQGRHDLAWRRKPTAYKILVSEIMLQQTQVARVKNYFKAWMIQFPTISALARASQSEVLQAWQGLGYNRRGLYLHQAAQAVLSDYNGVIPEQYGQLIQLPGVGRYTANAIMAFAYNKESLLLETNTRTAVIYHFFNSKEKVTEKEIESVLSRCNEYITDYRTWNWALMDYGSHLKQTVGNLNKKSSTYAKQSKFKGSKREVRAKIVRALLVKSLNKNEVKKVVGETDHDVEMILQDLVKEKTIIKTDRTYKI